MSGVSVIMPVYNNEHYIEAAVLSIMQQDFKEFELIIVDDYSQDNTLAIIRQLANQYANRIVVIEHPFNQGVAQARNTAILSSKYDVLMMADSDDIQHPERIKKMYQNMTNTSADIIFNDCEMIDSNGAKLGRTKGYPSDLTNDNVLIKLLERNHFWTSLVMLRKTVDIYFDSSLPTSEDYELFIRLALKNYRFVIYSDILTYYRIHENNLSANGVSSLQVTRDIFKKLNIELLSKQLKAQYKVEQVNPALAAVYAWREEYTKVITILESQFYSIEAFFTLAISYYKIGNIEKSLNLFKTLYNKYHVSNPAVLNNIGVLMYELDQANQNIKQWFVQALDIRSDYQDALHNLNIIQNTSHTMYRITERLLRTEVTHSEHYKLKNSLSNADEMTKRGMS